MLKVCYGKDFLTLSDNADSFQCQKIQIASLIVISLIMEFLNFSFGFNVSKVS